MAISVLFWVIGSSLVVSGLRIGKEFDKEYNNQGRSVGIHDLGSRLERTRIVNGKDVLPNTYPFLGIIIKRSEPKCGGSLIAPLVTITACHCLYMNDYKKMNKAKDVEFLVGAVDLDHARGLLRTARKLIAHSDCKFNAEIEGRRYEVVYDYGLIIFTEPFTKIFGYADVIALPDFKGTSLIDKMIRDEVPCVLMGWGYTSADAEGTSPTLKELSAKLRSQDRCAQEVEKNLEAPYHATSVCVTALGINQSACFGDSGGPLLCGKGEKQIIGVASYIAGPCGKDKIPNVFARLDMVSDWINKIVAESPTIRPFVASGSVIISDRLVSFTLIAFILIKMCS
ncbi:hypothetical protein GE061_004688 [Apolygus lucorum]|uniref:Uncharacterized protein n=1 Tax=Apolygus lucorum TaxID=248454 RepID=A0A6A4J3C9_APOLU|nr:hypothetical protein GE061_004688 [Apolygus lucorum]